MSQKIQIIDLYVESYVYLIGASTKPKKDHAMSDDELRPTTCKFCGKEFTPRRFWARFCSKPCHDLFYKNEQKEARLALREKRERERNKT